jgi:uncharacterized membrane protein
MEKIVKGFIGLFGGLATTVLGKEILVFIISLMPILELRGGLLAASLLGLDPIPSYIISVIGNIIPIPFILWFMGAILKWMKTRKGLKKIANWLDKKVEKNREKIERFGFWGLVLFVGIPLPGTGAWTGCLVASVLEMDKKKSFIAAMIGVFMASLIMMIISFGLLRGIIN